MATKTAKIAKRGRISASKTGRKKSSKKRASNRNTKRRTSKTAERKTAAKRGAKKVRPKKTGSKRTAEKSSKRAAQKSASKKTGRKTSKRAAKTSSRKSAAKKSAPRTAGAIEKAKTGARRAGARSGSATGGSGIEPGDRVPAFRLPDQDGNLLSSEDLAGAPYVLYFYPKDDTPGCTREACGFRDDLAAFQNLGARVIGVSPDKPSSHRKFSDKYDLNFTLLSDEDKELAAQFGVWVKKKNYGREYMGINRSTFVIDEEGVIRKAWRGVKVDGHVDRVLEATRDL